MQKVCEEYFNFKRVARPWPSNWLCTDRDSRDASLCLKHEPEHLLVVHRLGFKELHPNHSHLWVPKQSFTLQITGWMYLWSYMNEPLATREVSNLRSETSHLWPALQVIPRIQIRFVRAKKTNGKALAFWDWLNSHCILRSQMWQCKGTVGLSVSEMVWSCPSKTCPRKNMRKQLLICHLQIGWVEDGNLSSVYPLVCSFLFSYKVRATSSVWGPGASQLEWWPSLNCQCGGSKAPSCVALAKVLRL